MQVRGNGHILVGRRGRKLQATPRPFDFVGIGLVADWAPAAKTVGRETPFSLLVPTGV